MTQLLSESTVYIAHSLCSRLPGRLYTSNVKIKRYLKILRGLSEKGQKLSNKIYQELPVSQDQQLTAFKNFEEMNVSRTDNHVPNDFIVKAYVLTRWSSNYGCPVPQLQSGLLTPLQIAKSKFSKLTCYRYLNDR